MMFYHRASRKQTEQGKYMNVEILAHLLEVILCDVSISDAQKADVLFNVSTSC